jgi:hypothetical protein
MISTYHYCVSLSSHPPQNDKKMPFAKRLCFATVPVQIGENKRSRLEIGSQYANKLKAPFKLQLFP